MVKPWHMIIASVGVLAIVMAYNPRSANGEANKSQYEGGEATVDPEMAQDWELFKEGPFTLIRRTQGNGLITYEVTYNGVQIGDDVMTLYSELAETHAKGVRILIQANYDEELITYICEDGEVTKPQ